MKINWKKTIPIILVLSLSLISSFRLFRTGYFSMQDDMQIFRLEQFDKCVHDFQIPCRYIPDGGLGYGYPLFNYYSPLPYFLSEIFHLLGFSFINSIKITFVFSHVIAGIGMYLFSSLFWGSLGGIVSSIFFVFSPYMAVDSFVRGSIAEFLALSLVPLVFWSIYKLITSKNLNIKNIFSPIFFLTLLILSHNLTSFVVLILLAIFIFITLLLNKKFNLKSLFISFTPILFSLLLSSFFLLPAVFEKNLVTLDTMTQGYFYYAIHFVGLNQLLLSHFWGYGASLWGPIDGMSFQVGILHWIIPIILTIYLFLNFRKIKLNQKVFFIFFLLLSLFSLFLVHSRSTFIWKLLSFMPYFQFPWRFLGPAIFGISFISGFFPNIIKNTRFSYLISLMLIVSVVLINLPYFKEDLWYNNLTDNQKLQGEQLISQSGAGLKDYWPKFSQKVPDYFAPQNPTSNQDSNIEVISFDKKSNYVNSQIKVISNSAEITFPLVYFPKWRIKINDKPSDYQIDPNLGLIKITLPKGDYKVELNFIDTPIRKIANLLSLISLFGLMISLVVINRNHVKSS